MKKLKNEFSEMLKTVGNDFTEKKLTALFPIKGKEYKSELMVIGRAFNGWGGKEDDICWENKKGNPSKKTIENIIGYSEEEIDVCPMKWITDHWGLETEVNKNGFEYNMKKSAFWRVIKEILSELKITSAEDWASHLVWSELYKIASNKGGNPSAKLLNAQFEKCKKVLNEEIIEFKPKRILFLTGYDWFKDFENLGFNRDNIESSLVEWVGSYKNKNVKVVVAKHPQGKNETEYVNQVIKYFNK